MTKIPGVRPLTFLFFLILQMSSFAQNIDSLKLALKNAVQDTTRCSILVELSENASDEEWPGFNDQLKILCESRLKDLSKTSPEYLPFKKYYAGALNNCGYLSNQQGQISLATDYYNKSIQIQQEINDPKGLAASYNNIGFIYKSQGDISKALDYYNKSIKILESFRLPNGEVEDKKGLAYSISNIGIIYESQGDTAKALECYLKSLKIREEIKDKQGAAVSLNNIGFLYKSKNELPKALVYFLRSLKLREEIGDKQGIAISLNNVGFIYQAQGKSDMALDYFNRSVSIQEDIGDKSALGFSLNNIAQLYFKQHDLAKALVYAQRNMQLSKEIAFPENISNAAQTLSEIYRSKGDYKAALDNYILHIQMDDSIQNESTRKSSIKSQLRYEFEKKAATDSVANAKEKMVQVAQIEKQEAEIKAKRNQQYALYGGLVLVLLFAGLMYNRFKVTQRQNEVISEQKHLIEEKHKEITDSIDYAERIQRSFLASKELLDENLKDYFVLFRPKAVVSGDFYWASKLSNGHFALATADSTGHGVPGAIMSLLNITSLEKAVEDHVDPAAILNATRRTIIERLQKDGSAEGGKDGMDASLCVYDLKNKKLHIASANNPVWIIRRTEIIEIKPDKMPIGKHDKENISFIQQEITLQAGDIVYTLTDGFPDQFGGDKGKKFSSKNLRELLAANAFLPMEKQKELLERTFHDWAGGLEQVDDVTLIGVRI
jgi:serine phosphatase RsbU (regulator of sigma subunit)/Tfp pilus assembly protein PilF